MRDERVAELMQEAVRDKRPREHWEQGVLADAPVPRLLKPGVPWKWVLLGAAVSFVVFAGLGYYMYSHFDPSAHFEAVIAQKVREGELAKAEAERQQQEFAALK